MYTLSATGGTQTVSPSATTTYTAQASGALGSNMATALVTVVPAGSLQSINHVILMLQENHTFDNYFGMLNLYRQTNGWTTGDDGNTYVPSLLAPIATRGAISTSPGFFLPWWPT
jgi:hypothetical protein